MPEQIFTIPLTNGTSAAAQDIVHSWDIWSFFAEEDPKNATPITASLVLLGATIVASFALLNVLFVILFVKSVTKNDLRTLPQDPDSSGCADDNNKANHLKDNMEINERSFYPSTNVQIEKV